LEKRAEEASIGRRKGYDRESVLIAARDLFWERGYEATSIAHLEERTGLNRSSLYQEFGSKQALFEVALECYADRVISGLLARLRADGEPGAGSVVELFRHLAQIFRCDGVVSSRGCLMVNSAAELAARNEGVRDAAAAYRDRLRADFGAALGRAARAGEINPALVDGRAHLLASTLMGIWLTVRIDPLDAADLCDTIAADVNSWRER
jgi:AcrR family transcriptional regulator